MRLRIVCVVVLFLLLGTIQSVLPFDTPALIGSIRGDTTHVLFGQSIIAADLTGDGISDLVVDNGRFSNYLYRGGKPFDSFPLLQFNQTNSWGGAGDVNNDGIVDLLLWGRAVFAWKYGAYFGGNMLDTVRNVWFGVDTDRPCTHPIVTDDLDMDGWSELIISACGGEPVQLFKLGSATDSVPDLFFRQFEFPPNLAGNFGYAGAVSGDFNGDGQPDLAISQTPSGLSNANGRVYFYWGGLGFDTLPDFTIYRRGTFSTSYNLFGSVIASPGDLNADSYDDLFVAGNGLDDTAWVYFGGPDLDTIPDVVIPTLLVQASPAGDINRDGHADLLASYYGQFPNSGAVHIWYGGSDFDWRPDASVFGNGSPEFKTYFGQAATGIGDFNGDGVDDFACISYDIDTRATIHIYSGTGIPDDTPDDPDKLPRSFALRQNYPNPFNPSTTIAFDMPRRAQVTLSIVNILGQEIARLVDQEISAGSHSVEWDGRDESGEPVASGVYLYRLETGDGVLSRKMLLLK